MQQVRRKARESRRGAAGKSFLQAGRMNAQYTSAILHNVFDWKCPGTLALYLGSPRFAHTRKPALRKRQSFLPPDSNSRDGSRHATRNVPNQFDYSKQVIRCSPSRRLVQRHSARTAVCMAITRAPELWPPFFRASKTRSACRRGNAAASSSTLICRSRATLPNLPQQLLRRALAYAGNLGQRSANPPARSALP